MQCLASATSGQARRAVFRNSPVPFRSAGLLRRYARAPVRVNALHLPELHDAAMAATSAFHAATHSAQVVYTVAEEASEGGGGPVDWLANGFESILKVLNSGLESAGVPYAYGFAIILLTLLVKIATYPLSQKQVQSTIALQALQPQVRELQAKFANDPETLQLETARLYREAGVNPLAGCLPTLATIPVFIGLYRALTKAAEENLLTDPFFWIPSLGGPATLDAQKDGTGLAWLFPLQDGAPPIGWHDAGAYLVLPVLLVVSQYITQKLVSPPQPANPDPAAQSTQAILKFLPLMIGWFSLNVPAGLTLYWFVNNILSTAQQLYLKSTVTPPLATASASASGGSPVITRTPTGTVIDVPSSSVVDVKPREERVKKASGKELGSRKKKGDKFRALKAREAATKAADQVNAGAATQAEAKAPSSTTATQEAPQLRVPDAPPAKDNSSSA